MREKIISEYKRRKNRDDDNKTSAFKVNTMKSGGGTGDTDYKDSKKMFTCFHCNKNGHIQRNCDEYKQLLKNQKYDTHKANIIENDGEMLFAIGDLDGWIMDSGATCHITNRKEAFLNLDEKHREKVGVANGQILLAIEGLFFEFQE